MQLHISAHWVICLILQILATICQFFPCPDVTRVQQETFFLLDRNEKYYTWTLWQYGLWSFQAGGYKIRKIFA